MTTTITGSGGVSQVQDGSIGTADFAANAITAAKLPAGSVIQVVGFNSVASTATSSTSYIATHLSQSITPLYANSKIFVQIFGSVFFAAVSGAYGRGQFRKDGNTITGATGEDLLMYLNTAVARGNLQSSFVITTAGSTNAATYAYYMKTAGSACEIYRNSGILITEIKQ